MAHAAQLQWVVRKLNRTEGIRQASGFVNLLHCIFAVESMRTKSISHVTSCGVDEYWQRSKLYSRGT